MRNAKLIPKTSRQQAKHAKAIFWPRATPGITEVGLGSQQRSPSLYLCPQYLRLNQPINDQQQNTKHARKQRSSHTTQTILTSLVGERYCSIRMSASCNTIGSGFMQPSDSSVICTPRARALWGRCNPESILGMLGKQIHTLKVLQAIMANIKRHT